MTTLSNDQLTEHAIHARERAYAPYSKFKVGCALLDKHGNIHYGCNVENGAYGPTNCAERTALFRSIADGVERGEFLAMAVVADTRSPCTPCGVCRQVMVELCPPDMPVIMSNMKGDTTVMTVSELLPGAFVLEGNDN